MIPSRTATAASPSSSQQPPKSHLPPHLLPHLFFASSSDAIAGARFPAPYDNSCTALSSTALGPTTSAAAYADAALSSPYCASSPSTSAIASIINIVASFAIGVTPISMLSLLVTVALVVPYSDLLPSALGSKLPSS
ncbi:hypothetical protein B296_00013228 [Ensete ventricosum]|uniref:Uncharacterized protein n=1 Tax=Ensete ventricosum TaxID=4639 RepID=A0A427AVP2_ENSVE|nr:hypothetical protein B296_00013228 [Ensete ventricosum]